jgi:hypothetical protein
MIINKSKLALPSTKRREFSFMEMSTLISNQISDAIFDEIARKESDSFFKKSGALQLPLPVNRVIRLSSMRGKDGEYDALLIRLHLSGTKVPRHLIWNLLFKGINVIEWFLLYEFASRNKGDLVSSACLTGILGLSSATRKGARTFSCQLRPIHKKLRSKLPKTQLAKIHCENLLDYVIQVLKVPQKGLSTDNLLTVRKTSVQIKLPPPPQYVGVGYKDHGSMGDGNRILPPSKEEMFDPKAFFVSQNALEFWEKNVELHFQ